MVPTFRTDDIRRLALILILLAATAACIGLFYDDGGAPYTAVNHLGEEIELFGKGLYANDSLMIGAANQGMDAVVLLIVIPLTIYSLNILRRYERRGTMLMLGVFSIFLYLYATMALSIAYNRISLVYMVLLAIALWGFVLCLYRAVRSDEDVPMFDPQGMRWIGWLMLVLGSVTAIIWGVEPVLTLLTDHRPVLQGYPTLFTHALDIGTIIPLSLVAGWLIIRGNRLGFILAVPPLYIITMLVPGITAMTINQIMLGMEFTVAELIAFVASFTVMGLAGVYALVTMFRKGYRD